MIRFIISALCPGVQSRRHESFSCEDVRFQCFNHWSTYHCLTTRCVLQNWCQNIFRIHSNGSCVLRWHVISFILSSSTLARSLELTFRFFKGTGWIGTSRTTSTNQIKFTKSKKYQHPNLESVSPWKISENRGKSELELQARTVGKSWKIRCQKFFVIFHLITALNLKLVGENKKTLKFPRPGLSTLDLSYQPTPAMTAINMTSSAIMTSSPPWNSRRLVHSKEMGSSHHDMTCHDIISHHDIMTWPKLRRCRKKSEPFGSRHGDVHISPSARSRRS